MRLVSYARTSGSGDGEDSLAAQGERCAAWAADSGHLVVGAYRDESLCGALPVEDRPGLLAALIALQNGHADG